MIWYDIDALGGAIDNGPLDCPILLDASNYDIPDGNDGEISLGVIDSP
jgi:hypothetical protein